MNNIEEEFYKTFLIEQKCKNFRKNDQGCEECVADYIVGCKCDAKYYPPITDRILLELICILGTIHLNIITQGTTIKQLKDYILNECIENRKCISEQVRKLFESEEE